MTQIIARQGGYGVKLDIPQKKCGKCLDIPQEKCVFAAIIPQEKCNAPTILHTVDYEVAFVKGHAAILGRTQKKQQSHGLCCCKILFLAYFKTNKAKYLIELFTFCYFILEIEQKSTIFAANMFFSLYG